MTQNKLFVFNDTVSKRLDVFLCENLENITRAYIKTLNTDGHITVNGQSVKAGYALKSGDQISVALPDIQPLEAKAEDIDLDILYQDDDLVVLNKPQGIVVHPCQTTKSGTLVNALLYHIDNLSGINGVLRPGIVHRLDKDTSGLLVVAKNDHSHKELSRQLQDKTMHREYLALVNGVVRSDFAVEGYMTRHPRNRQLMTVTPTQTVPSARYSKTYFEVVQNFDKYTLLKCILTTGRTHQIRAHLKSKNITIVGDRQYGSTDKFKLNGQLLHAYSLTFVHPSTHEEMTFTCDVPSFFRDVLEKIK